MAECPVHQWNLLTSQIHRIEKNNFIYIGLTTFELAKHFLYIVLHLMLSNTLETRQKTFNERAK